MSGADIRAGGAFVEIFAKNENLKKGLEEAKKQLSNFQQSVNRVGGALGGIFGKSSNIGKGITNAFSSVGVALEKGFARAGAGAQLFLGTMRAVELKMRNFSVSARNLGLDLIKLGVVLGAPVVFGVKQFADFEEALAKVSTFLEEPAKFMPAFKKEILELSEEFGTSATVIADGLAEILSAGIPASKAMDFVKDSLKGSIGNVVAFKDQMSLLITVMQAYEGSNLTTAKATEILRVIVEKGRIPADQLAQSFGQVVSRAAQAGVSFEELAAAQSAMSLTGLTVAEQTTALNGVIAAFSGASPEAKQAFIDLDIATGGLGDTMSLATLRAKGFLNTVVQMAKYSPDDSMKVFKDRRAGNGIIILTSKLNEMKDALDAARSNSGLADSALVKMTKTLTHLGSKLLEVGRNLAIQFGEVLLDTIKEAAEGLIEIGKLISEFIKNNPTLALTLAKVAAAVLAAGAAFVSLGLGFSVLSTLLSGFVAVGALVVDAIVFIGGALASLFLFFTSGTGVAVLAIIAIISIFVDFGATFRSVTGSVKDGFKSLMGIFERFKDGIVETFALVKRAVAAKDYDLAVKIIVNKIKTIWFEAVEGIKTKYEELKNSFIEKFNQVKQYIIDFVVGVLNKLSALTGLDVFSDLGKSFRKEFSRMDGTLLGFKVTWFSVWGDMQKFAITTLSAVAAKLNSVGTTFRVLFEKLSGTDTSGERFKERQTAFNTIDKDIDRQKKVYNNALKNVDTPLAVIQTAREGVADLEKQKRLMELILSNSKRIEAIRNKIANTEIDRDNPHQSDALTKEQNDILAQSEDFARQFANIRDKMLNDKTVETGTQSFDSSHGKFTYATRLLELLKADSDEQLAFDKFMQGDASRNDTIKNFEDKSNKNLDVIQNQKILVAEITDLLGKGGDAWKKYFKDREKNATVLALLNEKNALKEDTVNAERLAAVMSLYETVKKGISGFIDDILPLGDAIVPNNKKDVDLKAKIEEQKIRDGIMGAFNTNALGDFSKGDVMKSVAELLKEQLALDKEQAKKEEMALKAAQETAINTKKIQTFE